MATSIRPASIARDVAGLMKANRRTTAAVGATQMPTWTHDRFVAAGTPATTYQLTSIPYGINVLARTASGGTTSAVFAEGTDYTVDYSTGIVTISATLAASDVIYVSYVTTDDLTALSGPTSFGGITDTFNRADSSTTLGSTSDGHATWTTTSTNNVPWGISTNAAKMFGGLGEDAQAYVDVGSGDGAVQVTFASLDNVTGVRYAGPMFRWSDHLNYWFVECKDIAGASQLIKRSGGGRTLMGSAFTTTVGDTVTVTLAGGSIGVAVNGTTVSTISDSFNQSATKHGMYSETGVTRFDNWSWSG